MTTDITFYPITESKQKLSILENLIKNYFETSRPFLIRSPNQVAAEYISHFIWSIPNTFYPHSIVACPSKELLAISLTEDNYIQASSIFNLSHDPIIHAKNYKKVYEFDDLTSESKALTSKDHYQFYKKEGFSICSL